MNPDEQLQQAVINAYQNNLLYLNQFQPTLYEKIITLSDAIAQGIYTPRYELEFKEHSYFDILDTHTNSYVYGKNSFEIGEKIANSIKNDRAGFNTLHQQFYAFTDVNKAKEVLAENSDFLIIPDIVEYNKILKKYDTEDINFDEIHKFIFIGTHLSTHILAIHKKIKAKDYLIFEPNLEIFRLSLFTLDYFELAKDSFVEFAVMEDSQQLHDTITTFFSHNVDLNYNIKFHMLDQSYSKYLEEIIAHLFKNAGFIFNYRLILRDLLQANQTILNNYNYLDNIDFKLPDELKQTPVLVVGPGPSLNVDIEWLRENNDKFIIIALGAAVKKLYRFNIKPHIIASADGDKGFVEQFKIDDPNYFEDIILLASPQTHQNIFNKFQCDNIFILQVTIPYQKSTFPIIDSLTIGEVAFSFPLILGFSTVYVLGLDLAIDKESGSTHDTTYTTNTIDPMQFDDQFYEKNSVINNTNLIKIKGNLIDETYTLRRFHDLFYYYNKATTLFLSDTQTIYNLSKKGAYIENTIPLDCNDIDTQVLSSNIDTISLHSVLKNLSSASMFNIDLASISEDIKQLHNNIEQLNSIKQIDVSSAIILRSLFQNMIDFLTNQTYHAVIINASFHNYKNTINNYLNFYLYQSDIQISSSDIVLLKELFLKQLIEINQTFITTYESMINTHEHHRYNSNLTIDSIDKDVKNTIMELVSLLENNGANLSNDLHLIYDQFGLSIQSKIIQNNFKKYLEIPYDLMPKLNDYVIELDQNDHFIVQSTVDQNATIRNQILELILKLFNQTNKMQFHKDTSIFYNLKEHMDLLEFLIKPKEDLAVLKEYIKLLKEKQYETLLLKSYFGCRVYDLHNELVLMPIIDFFNHSSYGNGIQVDEFKKTMYVESIPTQPTKELFISYNHYDSLDTLLLYGFVDTNIPYLFSVPVSYRFENGHTLIFTSQKAKALKNELPEELIPFKAVVPGLLKETKTTMKFTRIAIPNEEFQLSLLTILQAIVKSMFPNEGSIQIRNLVLLIEKEIIKQNLEYYRTLKNKVNDLIQQDSINSNTSEQLITLCEYNISHIEKYAKGFQ